MNCLPVAESQAGGSTEMVGLEIAGRAGLMKWHGWFAGRWVLYAAVVQGSKRLGYGMTRGWARICTDEELRRVGRGVRIGASGRLGLTMMAFGEAQLHSKSDVQDRARRSVGTSR